MGRKTATSEHIEPFDKDRRAMWRCASSRPLTSFITVHSDGRPISASRQTSSGRSSASSSSSSPPPPEPPTSRSFRCSLSSTTYNRSDDIVVAWGTPLLVTQGAIHRSGRAGGVDAVRRRPRTEGSRFRRPRRPEKPPNAVPAALVGAPNAKAPTMFFFSAPVAVAVAVVGSRNADESVFVLVVVVVAAAAADADADAAARTATTRTTTGERGAAAGPVIIVVRFPPPPAEEESPPATMELSIDDSAARSSRLSLAVYHRCEMVDGLR